MNVLDVIKDCIASPHLTKNYDIEELSLTNTLEARSVTNDSAFSGYSALSTSLVDQKLLRVNMRVWNGLRRLIVAMTGKGNCVVTREFGYFFPKSGGGKVAYSPSVEAAEQLQLVENNFNVSPKNRNVVCPTSNR